MMTSLSFAQTQWGVLGGCRRLEFDDACRVRLGAADHDPFLPRESQLIAKHPPAGLGDSDARDFDHTSAESHALAMRAREPVTDEIDHLPCRETVRPQDRLGAAVAAGRKQFERAVAGWRMSTALWTDGFASHRGRIAEDNRHGSVPLAVPVARWPRVKPISHDVI
jgi:hypothetical protein